MANDDFFADGQGSSKVTYKPSAHQFTDPLRLFKANDPYYWEVDNIPISQIEQNLLWLKDQVGVESTLAGNGRADFTELRPDATGDTRTVKVSPGRFMGRVNDAYNTGISILSKGAAANIMGEAVTEVTIGTPDAVIQSLAGNIATQVLYDNGLYDFTQHHDTRPNPLGDERDWQNQYTSFIQNNKSSLGILDMPKVKLALWKQGTTPNQTVKNFGGDPNSHVDLQQLAVEFTRVYGAPFRTALVDIPNELTIDVPLFEDDDYANLTSYVPSVRVDLLFIYTKPVDAASTTILKPSGQLPSTLQSPQLGLVKGAGVISTNPKGTAWNGLPADNSFFTNQYQTGKADPANYFDPSGGFDANQNMQTASPISDLNQSLVGVSNTFANFPSPDDLLNVAPYITDGVSKTNMSLIGQSVLPIAYIFVKRDAVLITRNDILDIRPFFRTAELTYNERAGLAAANPPTSLANPVVSKYQLADTTKKVMAKVNAIELVPPDYPRAVGSGYVFGGLSYGPEGVLARLAANDDTINDPYIPGADPNDSAFAPREITTYLQDYGFLPPVGEAMEVPRLPDWDVPAIVQQAYPTDYGTQRTDYFHYTYQEGGRLATFLSKDTVFEGVYGTSVRLPNWTNNRGSLQHYTGSQALLVRKKIMIDRANVDSWMTDYEVKVKYVNCAPMNIDPQFMHDPDPGGASWISQPMGLYVEKHPTYFIITAVWPNAQFLRQYLQDGPASQTNNGSQSGANPAPGMNPNRNNTRWGRIFVTGNGTFDPGVVKSAGSTYPQITDRTDYGSKYEMFPAEYCMYPTVHFEIIGYPLTYVSKMLLNAQGSDPTIILQTSL